MFAAEESDDSMMLDSGLLREVSGLKNTTKYASEVSILSKALSTSDANTIPYIVLFLSTILLVIILTFLHILACLIMRQRSSRHQGIKLKYQYLKDANNTSFLVIADEKIKGKERGYTALNSKLPHSFFTNLSPSHQGFSCLRKTVLVFYISFRVF